MAKPYANEMDMLQSTFSWASLQANVEALSNSFADCMSSDMLVIGSGGSITTAYALSDVHQTSTGRLSAVATTLQAKDKYLRPESSICLISAGGGNVDILSTFDAIVTREPRKFIVLCGQSSSQLAKRALDHPYVDLITFDDMPAGKDGFLATNSILAFTTLITRSYCNIFGLTDVWNETFDTIKHLLSDSLMREKWFKEIHSSGLLKKTTISLLHGVTSRLGAIDLESKFTEAGLYNLHMADYRNFAHGRHHWLAKHGQDTGIIAFYSNDDKSLAERTLKHIPSNIPYAKFFFDVPQMAVPFASLVAGLWITQWAGNERSIDPGKPGVPEFGRKIYHLSLPKERNDARLSKISKRIKAALVRKSGLSLEQLLLSKQFDDWLSHLQAFKEQFTTASFSSVIFDYDGTLVDTRKRMVPPCKDICNYLISFIESGIDLAFATGRGKSIRDSLRTFIPKSAWKKVLIGYYNGAVISTLNDDNDLIAMTPHCQDIQDVFDLLLRYSPIRLSTENLRPSQININIKHIVGRDLVWRTINEIILSHPQFNVKASTSGHSIDIIPKNVSKVLLLNRLASTHALAVDSILTIGDQGAWPGNDFEMLAHPFSLSVDTVSVNPYSCWNLGQSGQRGITVTLDYFKAMSIQKGKILIKGWPSNE